MQVPVVLNEASYHSWPPEYYQGLECINSIGEALRELAKFPRSVFLLADEKIGDMSLGDRPLRAYMGEASVRDSLRRILLFANKSPLNSFDELDSDGAECMVGDISSKGALYAYLLGTAALSFPTGMQFDEASINAKLLEIDGEGELISKNVVILNVASANHVSAHSTALMGFREKSIQAGQTLWAVLGDWFPNLRFLPRVEADLARFPKATLALDQVIETLSKLDSAMREWDGKGVPIWQSKISPESDTRRSLCDFLGTDGVVRNYELHARYTPGAGRIHFRILPEDKCAEVAYIGLKIS